MKRVLLTALTLILTTTGCAQGLRSPEPVTHPLYRLDLVGGPAAQETAPPAPDLGPGQVRAFRVDVRFRRTVSGSTETLVAPGLVTYPGRRTNVTVLNQLSYVETFTTEVVPGAYMVDPVIGVVQEGILLEAVVAPVPGDPDRVALAYRLTVADVKSPMAERIVTFRHQDDAGTIQLPAVETGEIVGARRVELGTTTLLGSLPAPQTGGRVTVLVRVTPTPLERRVANTNLGVGSVARTANALRPAHEDDVALEVLPPDLLHSLAPDDTSDDLLDAFGGNVDLRAMAYSVSTGPRADGVLRITALTLEDDLPLHELLDRSAFAVAAASGIRILDEGTAFTVAVPGVRLARVLDESYLGDYEVRVADDSETYVNQPVLMNARSGIEAVVTDDGRVRLRWSVVPKKRVFAYLTAGGAVVSIDLMDGHAVDVTVPLKAGGRLVPVARMVRGGTACVWVEFEPVRGAAGGETVRSYDLLGRLTAIQTQATR